MTSHAFLPIANFIWSVADLLRGPYRPPQYERVMLPMTVLRRFDCVLEHTKEQVVKKHAQLEASGKVKNPDATLNSLAKDKDGRSLGFHNHSLLDFQKLKGDPDNVGRHLQDYINGFSQNIRDIFDKFEFDNADFGYRRITVERPLRLRFQITDEARENFLNACPELLDAVEAIEDELGTEPQLDWNATWTDVQRIVKDCDTGWDSGAKGPKQKKLFRDCFTETDPKAERVIAKRGSFTGIVGEGDFQGQKLVGDLEPSALDQAFGIFPETKGKKGKALQYEADPKLRDNQTCPARIDP